MERKLISVHAVTIHIYTIAIILLFIALGVLGLKYLHLKQSVKNYTNSTIWMNQQDKPTGQISDYGLIIAQSVGEVPSADLQNYVAMLSKQLNRDIVVMDKTKKITADTVEQNRGTTYSFDPNNEINMSVTDGKTREFKELSNDYPQGVGEIVVPVKNTAGNVTGIVLISNTQVFK